MKRDSQLKEATEQISGSKLLFGYYGAGNFGDELLLEMMLNLFETKDMAVYYLSPKNYKRWHSQEISIVTTKVRLLEQILKSENLIVGGGGIWGRDANLNTLLMSCLLLTAKILRKKVHLLSVGYYDSATSYGKVGAYLAAKSAHQILARDEETYRNFQKISNRVVLAEDAAFLLPSIDRMFKPKFPAFINTKKKNTRTILVSTRASSSSDFNTSLLKLIKAGALDSYNITILELLPGQIDPQLCDLAKNKENVHFVEFDYNPASLYTFMRDNSINLVIAPQYHAQLVAAITDTKFVPLYYDNKNIALHEFLGSGDSIDVRTCTQASLTKDIKGMLDA